ncbi:MAG: Fe-S cluster assembly protein SufD, partial [Gammaproteobacteria bacterium]
MTGAQQQREWFEQLIKQSLPLQAANADMFHQARLEAQDVLKTMPVLSGKQEAWRYSRIDKLFDRQFAPASQDDVDVRIEGYLIPEFDSYRVVLVNGRYRPELSSLHEIPSSMTGISISSLHKAEFGIIRDRFMAKGHHADHMLNVLNTAVMQDGIVLHVDDGIELKKPVEIVYLNTGKSDFSHSRNVFVLGKSARAILVERFVSSHDMSEYLHSNLADIELAENSQLTHYCLQEEQRNAWHYSSLYLNQQKYSHYASHYLSMGSAWARREINVDLQREHATCDLKGLYVVGDKQLSDVHLDIKHLVPNCSSREQFKGILYGKGRAVFDGHILVEKQAQKSDARLSNDNLLLTREAEVDTKPQLEIYADDVKCSHGT